MRFRFACSRDHFPPALKRVKRTVKVHRFARGHPVYVFKWILTETVRCTSVPFPISVSCNNVMSLVTQTSGRKRNFRSETAFGAWWRETPLLNLVYRELLRLRLIPPIKFILFSGDRLTRFFQLQYPRYLYRVSRRYFPSSRRRFFSTFGLNFHFVGYLETRIPSVHPYYHLGETLLNFLCKNPRLKGSTLYASINRAELRRNTRGGGGGAI